jgi:hypothetical protein
MFASHKNFLTLYSFGTLNAKRSFMRKKQTKIGIKNVKFKEGKDDLL